MTTFLDMVADRLEGVDDSPRSRRTRMIHETGHVHGFAQRFDPRFVDVAANRMIGERAEACYRAPSGRLVISTPPQLGKTTVLRWLCARVLVDNPNCRIGYVSYGASLARRSGVFVRDTIRAHHTTMGISIARDQGDASAWQLDGYDGGMVSVGVGGGLTGRPIDFMIIDDPLRNMKDADSAVILEGLEDWWKTTALTRLSPDASVIVTQTRWAEGDLAGNRIAEGWPWLNIPAISAKDVPDALERELGVWLETPSGRTPEQWEQRRAETGERAWAAMYMGMPAPAEGGIFKVRWFATHRVGSAPELARSIVMIDPADNTGKGDEAGIIAGGTDHHGKHYILADRSGHYTVDQWFRQAFVLALELGSEAIGYERSLSGLDRRLRAAWKDIRSEALVLSASGWREDAEPDQKIISVALADLLPSAADAETRAEKRGQLLDLWPYVGKVLNLPTTGIPVYAVRAEGSKSYRAQLASPLFQNGSVAMVGAFPILEHVMSTWQEGQPSPDRMDACVHLALRLAKVGGSTFSAPKAAHGEIQVGLPHRRSNYTQINTRPT